APQRAAMPGNAPPLGSLNSPLANSRLISMPTTKKNTTMKPSLIQCIRSSVIENRPEPTVMSCAQNVAYAVPARLAHASATTVAPSRRTPPSTSTDTKSLPTGDNARPATGIRTWVRRDIGSLHANRLGSELVSRPDFPARQTPTLLHYIPNRP